LFTVNFCFSPSHDIPQARRKFQALSVHWAISFPLKIIFYPSKLWTPPFPSSLWSRLYKFLGLIGILGAHFPVMVSCILINLYVFLLLICLLSFHFSKPSEKEGKFYFTPM
jgi:hypothetical protein